MSRKLFSVIALALLPMLLGGALRAADASDNSDARLREALRSTMLQLRTAESDRASIQAAQAESDQKNKLLAEQVKTLVRQSAADKAAADKANADFSSRLAAQTEEAVRLKEALEKWKTAYEQAAGFARATEEQRARLAAENLALQRRVADQQTKNAALFKLGNEILTRYEKFGLGEALSAKEPFVGLTRVKLENLVQDYQDQLLDHRIKP